MKAKRKEKNKCTTSHLRKSENTTSSL